jgi:NADH:quinone reductase (non-electrogenic)
MKTRITGLFGIQPPIIQGGLHDVGFAEPAAAVSTAGGRGMITGLIDDAPTVKDLIDRIRAGALIARRLARLVAVA